MLPSRTTAKIRSIVDDAFMETKNILDKLALTASEDQFSRQSMNGINTSQSHNEPDSNQSRNNLQETISEKKAAGPKNAVFTSDQVLYTNTLGPDGIVLYVDLTLKDIAGGMRDKLVKLRVDMPDYEPTRVQINGKFFKPEDEE
ncbi:hypothetical protein DdX_00608 [Ditylenchus destructor]|uniref:Uncharacterized protein n=1 Tax=Ditylenchus destructor TaxID=166010 RepID=A0AAD4NK70_9BILA|nr:hypothetical protein DdX_00608 [Ditylenchus destructor]